MATRRSSSRTSSKSSKGRRSVPIDWGKANTQSGGGARYKPGTYKAKILKMAFTRSSKQQTPGIEVTFQFLDGKLKGKKLKETLYLTENSLFRVRLITQAVGLKVPKTKKRADINLDDYEGKKLYIEIADDKDETGQYATKSRVTRSGFISIADYESEDEDLEDADDEEEDDDEELDEDFDDEEEEEEEDDEDEDDDDEDDDDLDDM